MKRIKVVNDPTDLVSLLRAMDSQVKKNVFQDTTTAWITESQVMEKYGQEGVDALWFFEKMKLVETSWQIDSNYNKEKTYHSYYISVHINTSTSIMEISDVLYIASLIEEEYREIEDRLYRMVGKKGIFAGDLGKELDIKPTVLKGLVKRSGKLAYRGHRIERIIEEE